MREIVTTTAFRKDVKRMRRRRSAPLGARLVPLTGGKDLDRLTEIVERLVAGEVLEPRHVPHPLTGSWKPLWDLHIEPDWLLIYRVTDEAVMLARTGTHTDLFG